MFNILIYYCNTQYNMNIYTYTCTSHLYYILYKLIEQYVIVVYVIIMLQQQLSWKYISEIITYEKHTTLQFNKTKNSLLCYVTIFFLLKRAC